METAPRQIAVMFRGNDVLLHVGSKWGSWFGACYVREIENFASEWMEEPLELVTISTPGLLCLNTDGGVEFVLFQASVPSEMWKLAEIAARSMIDNGGAVGDLEVRAVENRVSIFFAGTDVTVDRETAHKLVSAFLVFIMVHGYSHPDDFLEILNILEEGGATICR